MSNIYLSWSDLKEKHTGEGIEIKYAVISNKYQVYLIDGSDAFIAYIPTQIMLDDPNFISERKTQLQSDLNDWLTNHIANAEETDGVSD